MRQSIIIGVAGGSGSGKSTFTNRLKDRFKDQITVVYHDSYYRDQSHLSFEERCRTNYDHPDSLETELLLNHLIRLRRGEAIECPVYDFSQHNRTRDTIIIRSSPVIILEGILVLSDLRLRELMDLKVFAYADADVRILRRIKRDVVQRGRDLDGIIRQYLTTVKPMHEKYVEPSRAFADIVVNGGKNEPAFALAEAYIEKHLQK
ncbi:MAG: uridine kinase [Eubacterium sp.]|nr:uridine kinase [Eubacterium sp.]